MDDQSTLTRPFAIGFFALSLITGCAFQNWRDGAVTSPAPVSPVFSGEINTQSSVPPSGSSSSNLGPISQPVPQGSSSRRGSGSY